MKKIVCDRNFIYRTGIYLLIFAIFSVIAYQYAAYMNVAKSTVPIMDFWQWIANYGQSVLDGTLTFRDFFNSDFGEHIQPVCMAINFFVLKISHFDVQPLVIWGMVLRILIAGLIVFLFVWRFRKCENKNYIILVLCATAITMGILNYNQWEMTTEPFSLTNAFRIGNYFLTFYLADLFVKDMGNRDCRKNLVYGALLGIYCAFLTVFVGAAYFVGHLVAIGLVMLWTLAQNRHQWKSYFWPMAVWAIISFVAACAYFVMVSRRGLVREEVQSTLNILVLLVQAVCFFWGGLFVHDQTMNQYGSALTSMVGAFVLIYSIFILIRYLKTHRDGKGMFPAMCLIYAMVLSVAISAGRVTLFGASSMSASRYVVETSIGFTGIIWMTYCVATEKPDWEVNWIKYAVSVCATLVLLISAARTEENVAPYRKIYNENVAEMMTNIEEYSDSDLNICQANSPDYVRYCVEFFRENNLSIFYEKES